MKTSLTALALAALVLPACSNLEVHAGAADADAAAAMPLGAFSLSLTVKDIAASIAFYEKLGFRADGGNPAQNWAVLRNGEAVIGLFQGMFAKNILTFNPGWNQRAEAIGEFVDVRELQQRLESRGVTLLSKADPTTTGPASFTLADPDGNPILFDQHVR